MIANCSSCVSLTIQMNYRYVAAMHEGELFVMCSTDETSIIMTKDMWKLLGMCTKNPNVRKVAIGKKPIKLLSGRCVCASEHYFRNGINEKRIFIRFLPGCGKHLGMGNETLLPEEIALVETVAKDK